MRLSPLGFPFVPPLFSSFTLSAYLRVFSVVSVDLIEGETFPIIKVWQSPMKDSLRTMVSFDPLKGRCCLAESSALMHSFRAKRDLLISAPSCLVWLLLVLTSLPLSFPAKSIKLIWPPFFLVSMSLTTICRIAWDLEELSFIPVFPTTLLESPSCISSRKESMFGTMNSFSPCTCTFPLLSSLGMHCSQLLSKSKTLSQ